MGTVLIIPAARRKPMNRHSTIHRVLRIFLNNNLSNVFPSVSGRLRGRLLSAR